MRYFYRKGDRVSGPFDLERIKAALGRGSIDPDAPVTFASGSATEPSADATWTSLRVAIPELFGQTAQGPSRGATAPTPPAARPPVQADFEAPRAARSRAGTVSVEVVNIRMDFGAMVVFMVKWAIASIPAAIILVLIVVAIAIVMKGVVAGILSQIF